MPQAMTRLVIVRMVFLISFMSSFRSVLASLMSFQGLF